MSTPKIIRVYSPSSKSQNNKQTTCTQGPRERSSLDTVMSNQKTSQMDNYYSLLIDQVKKLSRDNDRMWKLLTETEQQHSECNKTQKGLKQSLQCAEKQLSMMKQMYDSEKSCFEQSKIFFEKRQKEWQQIVGQLKKVIQNYESTNSIDMNRASQIFNHTSQMRSSNKVDQLPAFDKELSIYSKKNNRRSEQSDINNQFQSKFNNEYQNYADGSNIRYIDPNQREQSDNGSVMSNGQKKHRSKLFRSKNFLNKGNAASQSAKKICQKIYAQQMTKFEYFSTNPQDAIQMLTMEDIFERSLRKTYIKYRSQDQRTYDILECPHMEKLRTAKSSTKERLNKTIRKIFVFDCQQQLDDVIKYIEERVYKKYHLLKGELIFKFLEDKFKECEQIFQSSNSALDRLDKQPSNFINGAIMNSRFKDFQQKKKQMRSSEALSLRATQMTPINNLRDTDTISQCSRSSSQLGGGLSINSNIKDKTLTHSNNHMRTSLQKQVQKSQRDHSQKNIYTEKRISRKGFVEQLSRTNKSISMEDSETNKNLSSLIGASQQYELNTVGYSNRNDSSKGGIYNNRTTDQSRI